MTTRTHLSIGEVLSLLSDDFPDLTITKIRFLESQGLIDPERTASGYRKFYDFDIERLRWILRQQRENFLPLKVIRARLDQSEGKQPDAETDQPAPTALNLARDPGTADPPPVWMADHARVAHDRSSSHDGAETKVADAATTDLPGDASTAVSASRGSDSEQADRIETATVRDEATATDRPRPEAERPHEDGQAEKRPRTGQKKPKKKSEQSMTTAKKSESAKTAASTPNPAKVDVSDVSLTRAELLGAAGLDDHLLTELESFGIVKATDGPEADRYNADALLCARHASTMLSLGMEPRHLRIFKVSADREEGLYEQLILPLLRRRTPDARKEAIEAVERLVASGTAIHAGLLRNSLKEQLGSGR